MGKLDLQEKYGLTPEEFARKYLDNYKTKRREIIVRECPFCHGGQHNDKDTFAISIDDGAYNCKRGKCQAEGSFCDLLKEFNEIDPEWKKDSGSKKRKSKPEKQKKNKSESEEVISVADQKEYKEPDGLDAIPVFESESSKAKEYLELRGFSQETIESWDIRINGDGNLVFPYYDENGTLTFIKYRKPMKDPGNPKMWREKGTEPIFWGMDKIDTDKPLKLVEGEFDAMSLTEAGIDNVTTMPSGSNDLSAFNTCWNWMKNFDEIIIWTDEDKAGKELQEELVTRLGKWCCSVVQSDYKDANVQLYKEGSDSLIKAVENAKEIGGESLLKLSEVESFDLTEQTRIKSSLDKINHNTAGYITGTVSVWTGYNESGKSTFLLQELANAVDQGFTSVFYSSELPHTLIQYWVELQMAGPNIVKEKYDDVQEDMVPYVPQKTREKLRKWYRDKFYLYDETQGMSLEKLLDAFKYAARRYGAKFFVIDNLMSAMTGVSGDNYYHKQSNFVGKIRQFARKFDVHVAIVAHPRKEEGKLTKNDIAGSGDITNRIDLAFAVKRVYDEDIENGNYMEDDDGAVKILKNRLLHKTDVGIKMQFDHDSKRFVEKHDDFDFELGWEDVEVEQTEEPDLAPF